MNLFVELFLGHGYALVTVRFFHVNNVLRVDNAHAQQVGRGHVWAALVVGLPQNERKHGSKEDNPKNNCQDFAPPRERIRGQTCICRGCSRRLQVSRT